MRVSLFLIAGMIVLVGAREVSVRKLDRAALAKAQRACVPDNILRVRQPDVWRRYVKQLPTAEPFNSFIVEKARIRRAFGISGPTSFDFDGGHGDVLRNEKGEVARLTWFVARSARYSFDAPPYQLFNCAFRFPTLYATYSPLF